MDTRVANNLVFDKSVRSGSRQAVRRRLQLRVFAALLLVCTWTQGAGAQSKPAELKWGELAQLIGGQQIEMVLPDGTVVKGEAIAVREDSLVLDVKKTSNKNAQPKGNATIPREAVALLRLERKSGSWGRSLGTTVGVISGVVLGGYATAKLTRSAGPGISTFLGVASLGTVTGYTAGAHIDRQVTYIKVIP